MNLRRKLGHAFPGNSPTSGGHGTKARSAIRLGLVALGALSIATWSFSYLPGPAAAGTAGEQVLTEEQQRLKAAKEQRRPAEYPAPDFEVVAGPDAPVSHGTTRVEFTAAERAASISSEIETDERALAALGTSDPALADWYQQRIDENRARLETVADVTLDLPYVHLGEHSVYWTSNTLDSGMTTTKDPSNLLFYGVGSGNDAEYDLRNWSRNTSNHRWEDAAGGSCSTSHQWLATKNNVGDSWTWRRAPMASPDSDGYYRNIQVVADTCSYDSRHHLRIFDGPAIDTDYGTWSIGAAHFEDWNWPCCGHDVASWEDGDWRVNQSLRSSDSGPLLWFVDQIYYLNFGNAGTYQGHYTDGLGTAIEFNQ